MSRGRQIGRLKLEPLNPELKQRFLLDWEPVELRRAANTFPSLTSPDLFGNYHPLEVEIGAGSGEYLCHLAARRAQTNFLGIEVSRRAAHMAVMAAADLDLGNLRILRADFKLLAGVLAPQSWQAVYLHFPDPPHKREDAKHAIFDGAFLDAMAKVLVPGGQLSVVSDKADFFTRMLALAAMDGRFSRSDVEIFEPEVKSRFQLSWERKGIAPRRFVLRRH